MKLVKKGKKVYVENNGDVRLLRDVDHDYVDPLMIGVGPFGPMAKFFGFSEHTYILYFLIDSDARERVIENIHADLMPMFQNRRPIGAPGTLEAFWKNSRVRPVLKELAGALQFIPDDKLYLTHLSVRPKWRRNYLGKLMVDDARSRHPELEVVFDDPTKMGKQFQAGYER